MLLLGLARTVERQSRVGPFLHALVAYLRPVAGDGLHLAKQGSTVTTSVR